MESWPSYPQFNCLYFFSAPVLVDDVDAVDDVKMIIMFPLGDLLSRDVQCQLGFFVLQPLESCQVHPRFFGSKFERRES